MRNLNLLLRTTALFLILTGCASNHSQSSGANSGPTVSGYIDTSVNLRR